MTSRPGFYAGIGSRDTPQEICSLMAEYARRLAECGWRLRSDGEMGAGAAFEAAAGGGKQIFLPWRGFEGSSSRRVERYEHDSASMKIAAGMHGRWAQLPPRDRLRLARAVRVILGPEISDPVSFVLCWTADGSESRCRTPLTGGAGLAIALAARHGVPVLNLARDSSWSRIELLLEGKRFAPEWWQRPTGRSGQVGEMTAA